MSTETNLETVLLPPRPLVKPVKLDNIPAELKTVDRWLVWRYELRQAGRGEWRWTKVPYSPASDGVTWKSGSATDPATWGTFEAAVHAYTDPLDPEFPQFVFDGLGFVLGDGFVGIDLDKCRGKGDGVIDPWAAQIITDLRTYTEVSPSETGAKLVAKGSKPGPRCRTGQFEMYSERRFFTVTGHTLNDAGVEDREAELAALYHRTFPAEQHAPTRSHNAVEAGEDHDTPLDLSPLVTAPDDGELWIGAGGDSTLVDLHLGEWRNGYSSQSEAEMAYISRLAYWTGPDAVRLDRLYRDSWLFRDKWDSPRAGGTVGSRLIARVLATKDKYHDWARLGLLWLEGERVVGEVDFAPPRIISPAAPLEAAKAMLADKYIQDGLPRLIHTKGRFSFYTGTHYRVMEDAELRSTVWKWLGRCRQFSRKGEIEPFQPNTRRVHDVIEALRACCELPAGVEAPCWTDGRDLGRDVIAFKNGLLAIRGEPVQLPHTPAFYSLNCLPFEYAPTARCPQWLTFLGQVFDNDGEQIDTLAEWFGYCLTLDTSQQKIALLNGPPRSGKSTIVRLLGHLLGGENCTPVTMAHLGSAFGLECLVGKMAGLMGDAHMPSDRVAEMVERFKGIVGEDEQIINPKGRPAYKQKLYARFTVAVNTMPKMPDASAAMRSRLLVFRFRNSFVGKEDPGLEARLKTELSGITNWALDGLRRLRERGRFVQPAAGQQLLDQFARTSSPVKAFLEDCCEVGDTHQVGKQELYRAWCQWCLATGHREGSDENFGTNLYAAVAHLGEVRPTLGGKRVRCYTGLGLRDGALAEIAADHDIVG